MSRTEHLENGTPLSPLALRAQPLDRDRGVQRPECLLGQRQTEDNARRLLGYPGPGPRLGWHRARGREIAGADVFGQSTGYDIAGDLLVRGHPPLRPMPPRPAAQQAL